jgi:alcohol dehydrogenase
MVDRVLYGPGSVEHWVEIPNLPGTRALLVTTGSVARTTLFSRLTALLAPILVATFRETQQHAPESVVQRLAETIVESGADTVVSFGGGSVIDAAKAAIDELARESRSYRAHVAIPTTLSAAEFAASYGITDDETRRKRRGSHPGLLPRAVILDAELTIHTPDWLWHGSGLRAVDHAMESVYSPEHNPVADALALDAICLLFRHLLESTPAGERLESRQHCQVGAWLSWTANESVSAGTSHRLGRLIGPLYAVPHGFTSAILLPHVLEAALPTTEKRQTLIAEAARQGLGRSRAVTAADAAEMVRELVHMLGLPSRLRDVGLEKTDLQGLAAGSDADLRILEAAW